WPGAESLAQRQQQRLVIALVDGDPRPTQPAEPARPPAHRGPQQRRRDGIDDPAAPAESGGVGQPGAQQQRGTFEHAGHFTGATTAEATMPADVAAGTK